MIIDQFILNKTTATFSNVEKYARKRRKTHNVLAQHSTTTKLPLITKTAIRSSAKDEPMQFQL